VTGEALSSLRVSVVIPTFRRPAALSRCLDALAAQTIPRDAFEVVVVDDGGELAVDQMDPPPRRDLNLQLVRQANQGPGSARNAGVAVARGEFAAFTDDDCLPDPDWLERLLAGASTKLDVLYGGRLVNALDTNIFAVASQLILNLAYCHHNPEPPAATFVASNNMLVPLRSFRELGGFDPAFRVASEDRDLCARWLESGRSVAYLADAVVRHANELTLGSFLRQHFGYGRGAWRFHRALRSRGAPRLVGDLGFHLTFVARAFRSAPRLDVGQRIRLAGLLVLWQLANAVGFAFEAGRSQLGARSGWPGGHHSARAPDRYCRRNSTRVGLATEGNTKWKVCSSSTRPWVEKSVIPGPVES